MNMLVIEHGPEISMPGRWSSSGTGATRQSPVRASLAGGCVGGTPSVRARVSTSARRSRSARTRVANSSWRRTR